MVSMVLFCFGQNVGFFWIKESTDWIRVSCVMENVLSTVFWLFLFVAMRKKQNEELAK